MAHPLFSWTRPRLAAGLMALVVTSIGLVGAPPGAAATVVPPTSEPPPGPDPAPVETTATTTTVAAGEPPSGGANDSPGATATDGATGGATAGDGTVDPDDPLANEGPAEEAPATDLTVPPPSATGQEAYEPAQILWSSVVEAERKLERSREAKRAAVAETRALRLRRKQLDADRLALDAETSATVAALAETTERLRDRAVVGFRHFGSGSEADPDPDPGSERAVGTGAPTGRDEGEPTDLTDLHEVMSRKRRSRMVATALDFDQEDLDRLGRLRRSLSGDTLAVLDRLRLVSDYLSEAETAATEADGDIRQAEIEYEAFKAGSEIFIDGVVFPIGGPYSLPLIDSFGFPRMTGTPDEHWHEGIDLFAPRGTPLVATERGVITKVGNGRLGGLKFWLKGESGTEWYYAHLDAFAPGLTDGLVVEAGDVLGFVGNTGNAVGTPPHLHMQMHPDGGRPVNPYPLLKVVSDLDQAAIVAAGGPDG